MGLKHSKSSEKKFEEYVIETRMRSRKALTFLTFWDYFYTPSFPLIFKKPYCELNDSLFTGYDQSIVKAKTKVCCLSSHDKALKR